MVTIHSRPNLTHKPSGFAVSRRIRDSRLLVSFVQLPPLNLHKCQPASKLAFGIHSRLAVNSNLLSQVIGLLHHFVSGGDDLGVHLVGTLSGNKVYDFVDGLNVGAFKISCMDLADSERRVFKFVSDCT